MMTHARVVDVMSKTRYKATRCRHWKYLDQGDSLTNDKLAEQRDVQVQRGYTRKFCRLAPRKEVTDFFEQIKAEANHHLIASSNRDSRSGLCSFVNNNFVTRAVKQKAAPINRHSRPAKRKEIMSGGGACPKASAFLERLPPRTVKEKQPSFVLRNKTV